MVDSITTLELILQATERNHVLVRGGGEVEAGKKNRLYARLEGVRESNQDAGTGAGRVWRTPMKTNYSDLKFHLLLLLPLLLFRLHHHHLADQSISPLSFPSWGMTVLRAHSARPYRPVGCFEDDKRKGNSVTRGDKFASRRGRKVSFVSRGARNAVRRGARCKFSSSQTRRLAYLA